MIRHGRQAIDRTGIAALHGLRMTAFKGKRRRRPPWEEPGYPAAINLDPAGEAKPRTWLYDEKQATAYAADKRIPSLPVKDHPLDLLTERDAAAHLKLSVAEFRDLVKSQRVPLPDEKPFGVNHWYRRTLDTKTKTKTSPDTAAATGRSARSASDRTPRQRLKDVLAALPAGQTVASTELARTTGVALSTARAFLRTPGLRVTAVLTEPVGPGLPVWDDFVAALHRLAELEKYAGIPIRVGWSARSAGGRTPRQRLRDAVAALPAGETVGPTELARRAGVARPTARAFLREQGLRVTAVLAGPVGPGLPAWNEFVAAVHKLATDKKYAGITLRLTED